MTAHEKVSKIQFSEHLPRIEPGIGPEFGAREIPEGMVRFNHYTNSPESGQEITRTGLQRSKSEESFARGGTESPQVFMTAGKPEQRLLDNATVVEGWADPVKQLDVGGNWRGTDPVGHAADVEGRRGTITAHGDIPANQILGVHEPWHESHRYITKHPDMEANIMAGNYDDIEPKLDRALSTAKLALSAKVMLGGKLQGDKW